MKEWESNLGRTAEHSLVLVTFIRFLRGDARGAEDGETGRAVHHEGVADGDLEARRPRLHRNVRLQYTVTRAHQLV